MPDEPNGVSVLVASCPPRNHPGRASEAFDPSFCGTLSEDMSGMLERRASRAAARAAIVIAGVVLCLAATGFVASTAGGSPVSLGEGVYTGAADPSQIAAFDATTGTHSTIAADYLPTNSGWSGMDGRGGSLRWLFAQGWTGTP